MPKTTARRSVRPLQKVHVDLAGPRIIKPAGGEQYGMAKKYDYSHYNWAFFLKEKSQTTGAFDHFLLEVNANDKVDIVRSDIGGKFTRSAFKKV